MPYLIKDKVKDYLLYTNKALVYNKSTSPFCFSKIYTEPIWPDHWWCDDYIYALSSIVVKTKEGSVVCTTLEIKLSNDHALKIDSPLESPIK